MICNTKSSKKEPHCRFIIFILLTWLFTVGRTEPEAWRVHHLHPHHKPRAPPADMASASSPPPCWHRTRLSPHIHLSPCLTCFCLVSEVISSPGICISLGKEFLGTPHWSGCKGSPSWMAFRIVACLHHWLLWIDLCREIRPQFLKSPLFWLNYHAS